MRRLRDYGAQVSERAVEINVIPLIDCMLFLLIFFISTTVFEETTGLDVQKPQAASAAPLAKQSITIAVSAEGRIAYGGRAVDLNAVRGLVAQQLREQDAPVIILSDERTPTGKLVDVIDECKLAGAKQVSIAATHEMP